MKEGGRGGRRVKEGVGKKARKGGKGKAGGKKDGGEVNICYKDVLFLSNAEGESILDPFQ